MGFVNTINNEGITIRRELEDKEIESKLKLIGCNIDKKDKFWEIEPPAIRRLDLKRKIDLIEEIARLYGYDNFGINLPAPLSPGALNPKQKFCSVRNKDLVQPFLHS